MFEKPGLKPNSATQPQALSDTNFVHQVEKVTQDIHLFDDTIEFPLLLPHIMTTILGLPGLLPGDIIKVPHASVPVSVRHAITMAELRRLRKQFFKFAQLHPPPVQEIGNSFVEFLNTNAVG